MTDTTVVVVDDATDTASEADEERAEEHAEEAEEQAEQAEEHADEAEEHAEEAEESAEEATEAAEVSTEAAEVAVDAATVTLAAVQRIESALDTLPARIAEAMQPATPEPSLAERTEELVAEPVAEDEAPASEHWWFRTWGRRGDR